MSLLRSPDWIHRRTETVTLLDENTIHKRVTIDSTVPPIVRERVAVNAQILPFVPLGLMPKLKLRNFDMTDARGDRLPVLTRTENGDIAANALRAYAENILGRSPTDTVTRDLITIARDTGESLKSALARMTTSEDDGGQDAIDRRALHDAEDFVSILFDLAQNFILAAVTHPDPGTQRLLKFAYDAEVQKGRGNT